MPDRLYQNQMAQSLSIPAAIATMTRARSDGEAAHLISALTVVSNSGLPIFISDGGSTAGFVAAIAALPGVCLVPSGNTLVGQTKAALYAAVDHGASFVVYTEPDKQSFFANGLAGLISAAMSASADAIVAARDSDGMSTFPPGQRRIESMFNDVAGEFLGVQGDILYGPIAFRSHVVRAFLESAGDDLGWGWRPFVLARCVSDGGRIALFEQTFKCPKYQTAEDTPTDRLYRLSQLSENIRGLYNGLTRPTGERTHAEYDRLVGS